MTRYALYYAPAAHQTLWQLGCAWLGRDPTGGPTPAPLTYPGISTSAMMALTASPRRYGFHATLKAPFRLAPGFTEVHLLEMARAFSQAQRPVELPGLEVRRIDDFLALCPTHRVARLDALAMRCLAYFDALRAPLDAKELAHRHAARLTPRQEALLQRWGYPHTEEEFRFHMTLTDSLDALDDDSAAAILHAANTHFQPMLHHARGAPTTTIEALTIFKEAASGAPMQILDRFPFTGSGPSDGVPAPGRLYYVVGPSGVGKDSLLHWVKRHVGDSRPVRFATRTITRAAHASEDHEPVAVEDFWQTAGAGGFAMMWQANGACYAVRRGIEAELMAGYDVVINGSREYVPKLIAAFPDARIIWITAATDIIERRLIARQRETGAALLQRLQRSTAFSAPEDCQTIHIDNSGPIEVAGGRLLALLRK